MFARIVWRSMVGSRARLAVALAATALPAAVVTAVANFTFDAESRIARDLGAAAQEAALLGKLKPLLTWVTALILGASGLAMAMTLAAQVGERSAEIGLLKALGATPARVLGLFAAQGALLLALGLGCGAVLGILLSDLMARGVFGVPGGFRPAAVAAAAVACGLLTLAASVIPVRRALVVDAARVLKGE
jgi:putative ABC transport system permease protein